jgi:hypothetical protein
VSVVKQESKMATPGNVLRQSPPGDSKALKGSTVTIYVAKAPPNNGNNNGNGNGGTGPGGSTTPDCTADPTQPGCP